MIDAKADGLWSTEKNGGLRWSGEEWERLG
jgi:hypothetical protein